MTTPAPKHLLRAALTSPILPRRAALAELSSYTVPASFLTPLLSRLSSSPDHVCAARATALILSAVCDSTLAPYVAKKLPFMAASMRKTRPSVRDALYTAKLAVALVPTNLHASALDLLLASIGAIEAVCVPPAGPQRRARSAALSSAYRSAAVVVEGDDAAEVLLKAAEGAVKTPAEGVAALGMLAHTFAKLGEAMRRRYVAATATLCVKCGAATAADVVRACEVALANMDAVVVLEAAMPVVERALLREPELALPAAAAMFGGLRTVDLSPVAGKVLFPAVVQAVKSSNERTRASGVRLAEELSFCVSGEKERVEGVEALCAFLKGARYAYQKVAAVDAITALACTAVEVGREGEMYPAKWIAALEAAAEGLRAVLASRRESNAEARAAGMRAIARVVAGLMSCEGRRERGGKDLEAFAEFFRQVLTGKFAEADRRALLMGLTTDLEVVTVPAVFVGEEGVAAVQAVASKGIKAKDTECLRAFTLLTLWAGKDGDNMLGCRGSKMWKLIGDPHASPVLQDPCAFPSMEEVHCVLHCCEWMVANDHEAAELVLEVLFKLCLDERSKVSSAALQRVCLLRRASDEQLQVRLFMVLWTSQFTGAEGRSTKARTYDFDDGMVHAEKLGRTLLAAVLPRVPVAVLPLVLVAANHPRLSKSWPARPNVQRSRYWVSIERTLQPPERDAYGDETDDWLEHCLRHIFTVSGLLSNDSACTDAAVNALGALADSRNVYSVRVLRRSVEFLRPFALGASRLGDNAHEALRLVEEADLLASQQISSGEKKPVVSHRKMYRKQAGSSDARVNQQRQAEIDRARAAAANASAAAGKAEAARSLAAEASKAFQHSREALRAVRVLATFAPAGVHTLTASMLSLIIPSAKLLSLEDVCRSALSALTQTCSKRLRSFSVEISSTVYGLERHFDVRVNVPSLVYSLRDIIPPALSAEDFSLVSPIVRAALLRDPEAEDQGIMSGKRGSTKRRDAIAVVKAACQILLEHCKPEAIDSAIAAAASRAGSWAVTVLEREDGAFAAAAEALALLAGTALTPGTDQLSQVLEGIVSGKSSVRDAALAALARLPQLSMANTQCPRDAILGRSLWLARYDPDEANAELAEELWHEYNHPLFVPEDVPGMLGLLAHQEWDIRFMSAKAIASALQGKENEGTRNTCIPQMFTMYLKHMPIVENADANGIGNGVQSAGKRGRDRPRDETEDLGWPAREGVALAIESLAEADALKAKDITASFAFLAGRGLGDADDKVRARMSRAATAVVQAAGTVGPSVLLPMIEKQLNAKLDSTALQHDIVHADRTRENLVMCLGSVAGFLSVDDPRIGKITQQVMKTAIETPSDVVQLAAARCLIPLAKTSISKEREETVTTSLVATVYSDKAGYGERRGAAYSLAGIGRGLGVRYMRRLEIMEKIESALADKNPRRRQGGFLLVETHALLMERLFEPFAVAILPYLLSCMGDSAIEVRKACWSAAQAAMSEISSQGVKMILPSLLKGLQDRQWRTKAGSAEVLGAMAFCAPRQLAQCLPEVVPKLAEALADAHPKVVDSAESAVNRIAAVVRSPEVRKLSPFLLAALRDPAGKTRGAIDAMLASEFVHAIDTASLALLIPPLYRGLRERSSELKKRSAAIVGSMCNNVSNPYDVVPYLDLLIPSLRVTLLDAIPDVRRTSARALGALAVSLGEKGLPDIVPWLINALLGGVQNQQNLSGERIKVGSAVVSSSAERSGAAMGLAEVASSMNDRRLEDVLNRVLVAGQSSTEGKEGGLMLIAAMPRALGERFEARLSGALAATLVGLADDADNVREAALEAGRSLVAAYAKTSLEHLLPEILSAMREKLWRIRMAATRLLGDMLLVIAGARPDRPEGFGVTNSAGNDEELQESDSESGSNEEGDRIEEGEEEEGEFDSPEQAAAAMTIEATMKAIEDVLGFDRRNDVLAALYIIRCDVSIGVRQTGMQVWKAVVSNTPRVLREIMPSAVRQIVDGLGDEDEERRTASGKTLGDLSQKLGDRVVPEVLPALHAGVADRAGSERIRKGACEGLGELVAASPHHQLEEHGKELVDTVYLGLCDNSSAVRAIAAEVFASLLKPLDAVAVDAVVPRLIYRLSEDNKDGHADAELALNGLKQILRASGSRLMAIVVPRLLKEKPLNAAAARALATAAMVGDTSFEPHVVDVTESIIDSMEATEDCASVEPLEGILGAIAACGTELMKPMLDVVYSKFNEGYADRRVAASRTCAALCRSSNAENILPVSESLLEVLIRQLADIDIQAAQAALHALAELSGTVPSRELMVYIPTVRQALRSTASGISITEDSTQIQGLQLPKAVAPFVPILTEGLLHGEAELREQAALGVGEIVEFSDTNVLSPYVIKLTGPLIRVMSGRFPWQVKGAVLKALLLLLKKVPAMLKVFAPQLQSTFVKSLSDKSGLVRKRACAAVGALVPIQSKLEGLLNDLVALGCKGDTTGSRTAAFHSCSQVFRFGKKLPESCFSTLPESITTGLSDDDSDVSRAAGRALGFLAGRALVCDQYEFVLDLVHSRLDNENTEYTERVAALRALGAIYVAGEELSELRYEHVLKTVSEVYRCLDSAIPDIQCAACSTGADLVMLLTENLRHTESVDDHVRAVLLKLAGRAEIDPRPDVRVAALEAMKKIILTDKLVIAESISSLVVCAAESNTAIRNAADRVLRRALLVGRDLVLNEENMKVAKDWLGDEDRQFIDRRIPKLRALPESDGEHE